MYECRSGVKPARCTAQLRKDESHSWLLNRSVCDTLFRGTPDARHPYPLQASVRATVPRREWSLLYGPGAQRLVHTTNSIQRAPQVPAKVKKGRKMPGNPVSCHLITWGQDFERGLREVEELGFHACEPFPQRALEYEARPQDFRELLASHHLRLSALYGGGRFGDPAQREAVIERNKRLARFLAAIGVDRLVFGPGGPRTPGGSTPEELREAAKTINEAARACYDLGVLACVHPHLGTEIETEPEIDTVMELTDPRYVFFCPDTAHLTAAEIDVPRMIRRYGERMRYMHIKDLRAGVIEERRRQRAGEASKESEKVDTGTEQLPIFCELGRGIIDYAPIMQALADVRYRDWITVEIDVSLTTPKESLSICRDYIQNTLGLQI